MGKLILLELLLKWQMKVWWMTPTLSMADEVWRDLRAMFQHMPDVRISETDKRIDLTTTGAMIAIKSAHNPHNLRGAGLDYVILDEAAFMSDMVWPEIVRPMLASSGGGALFLSTPNGRNWFWDLYRIGLDPEEPEWQSYHRPSTANPLIPSAEWDSIRRQTPSAIWQVEYLAQFTGDGGQVFRHVESAITAEPDAQPTPDHRYIMGVDWGRDVDFTVAVVIDATQSAVVAIDRFNQVDWALQRGRISALYRRWQPAVIIAEQNSIGSVNIAALQAEGLPVRPFITTAKSKPPLIDGLALAIEQGALALVNDPVLIGELQAYRMKRRADGGYSYSAPDGGHDDTVIALALAWYGAQQGGVRVDFA